MEIKTGSGVTTYGSGTVIYLTGDEVALAIYAYLVAHGVYVVGPRTVMVNGQLCDAGRVYVDPSGSVVVNEIDGKRDGK